MLDEREVPAVAFVECVKVHHVKLANIDREPCTVGIGFPRLWRRLNVMGDGLAAKKEVFPPPLEHTYPQVICMPHPAQAHCVTLEDDVLCGLRILDILVDLHKVQLREEVQWRKEGVKDTVVNIPIYSPFSLLFIVSITFLISF
jgi:hypothetical protein